MALRAKDTKLAGFEAAQKVGTGRGHANLIVLGAAVRAKAVVAGADAEATAVSRCAIGAAIVVVAIAARDTVSVNRSTCGLFAGLNDGTVITALRHRGMDRGQKEHSGRSGRQR